MLAVFAKPFKPLKFFYSEPGFMSVQYVDVDDRQDVGQRVDNYLMRILKGVPRQHIYRILRRGEVRVNGGRIKASYRLQLSDRIRIPPIRTASELPVQYSKTTAQQLSASILFEDDQYLVLNKPAGIAVHGGSGISAGVVEILRDMTANPRLELVHRLDRDTSGCLALAKNRQALQAAQLQFRQRRVKKIYEAFVHGLWPANLHVVQLKLLRYETSWGERRVKVASEGQTARTDFEILDQAGEIATRLQATLHTGRTHQIRVHTSASHHPIIGDDKYGRREVTDPAAPAKQVSALLTSTGLDAARLCLHAKKLVIPLERGPLKVVAAVDEAMETIWQDIKALEPTG
jgi:23S rRNA pseudouridine955/2504/2580 synthase